MKTSKWLIVGIVVTQLLLYSCSTVRISENSNYKDSEFVFGSKKTAILVCSDNIMINEFAKTFKKRFKEKSDFVKQYDSLCALKFKEEKIFGEIKYDESLEFLKNDSMVFTREQQKKVDSLFLNTTADYLIKIGEQEVTNSLQGNPGMPMYTGGMSNGGMTMSVGTQSESCVIKSHFQIYDIKTRKKVLDFVSKGSAGVLFFAFEQALIDAMNNSVKNSAIYLKTGKLKF
jgi:hypothetical protein